LSKLKNINSHFKLCVIADENDKNRVLDYGADEFAIIPLSFECLVNKYYFVLGTQASEK
jgi:hypothetical protein